MSRNATAESAILAVVLSVLCLGLFAGLVLGRTAWGVDVPEGVR